MMSSTIDPHICTKKLTYELSVSHTPKNLFTWTKDSKTCLGSVRCDKIQMLSLDQDSCGELKGTQETISLSNPDSTIIQAKVISTAATKRCKSTLILVITTESNIQCHDLQDNCILYVYAVAAEELCLMKGSSIDGFSRGIASHGHKIFIGLITGSILIISIFDGNVKLESIMTAHTFPVTDITSDTSLIVSGDAMGNIMVWDPTDDLMLVTQFDGFNQFPVTCLTVLHEVVCAAYASGHIRVYGITQKRLLSEVWAHQGSINSLDVTRGSLSSGRFYILSTGDDSCIRLWLANPHYPWIQHEESHSIKNSMVVGASFLNGSSNVFAAAAYDSETIHIFERSKKHSPVQAADG